MQYGWQLLRCGWRSHHDEGDAESTALLAPAVLAVSRSTEHAHRSIKQADEQSVRATTPQLRIAMLGPALHSRGGITSVQQLILEAVPPDLAVEHIATVADGSKLAKLIRLGMATGALARALRRGVEVTHFHCGNALSLKRKALLAEFVLRSASRVIFHLHGTEYMDYWAQAPGRERKLALRLFERIHALVVLGDIWRDFFVSIGVDSSKIVILPNPVRLPDLVPERRVGERVQFIYLGGIEDRKGPFDLPRAVARLEPAWRARMHVTIAGKGAAEIRQHIANAGLQNAFTVHDWVDTEQRDRLLASADVFVLPSRHEGLPMAMLEAMAWGLAPICTPVGSVPQYIESGTNGLLVAPGDIDGLTCAMKRLAADPIERQRMGRVARTTVEPLSTDSYVRKLRVLYRAVVEHGRPDPHADGAEAPQDSLQG
jgi:glycosyltransferase involved in cell wall biosynthesis